MAGGAKRFRVPFRVGGESAFSAEGTLRCGCSGWWGSFGSLRAPCWVGEKRRVCFFSVGGFVSGAALEFGLGGPVEPLSEPLSEAQRNYGGLKESVRERRTERAGREGYIGLVLHREMRCVPVHTFPLGRDASSCARGRFRLFLIVFSLLFLTRSVCRLPSCAVPAASGLQQYPVHVLLFRRGIDERACPPLFRMEGSWVVKER